MWAVSNQIDIAPLTDHTFVYTKQRRQAVHAFLQFANNKQSATSFIDAVYTCYEDDTVTEVQSLLFHCISALNINLTPEQRALLLTHDQSPYLIKQFFIT